MGRDGRGQPRILVLSARYPFPPSQGDEARLAGLLEAAREIGTLTLAVRGDGRAPKHGRDLRFFPVSGWDTALGIAQQVIRGRPAALGPHVRRMPAVEGPWDMVIASQLKMWRWAAAVDGRLRVLDLVDALGRYVASPRLPFSRRLPLLGVETEERAAVRSFDRIWVSSEADREFVEQYGRCTVEVVPNGPLHKKPLPPAPAGRHLIFVGNLRYPPNRQGVRWFLGSVWPDLAAEGFTLDLVGRGTEDLPSLPGIRALGYVQDVEPLYRRANCAVSPVGWGTGSQLKVWEALGYGRRIVVTPEGAVAIGPQDGVLVAEGRDGWIEALRGEFARGEAPVASPRPIAEIFRDTLEALVSRI